MTDVDRGASVSVEVLPDTKVFERNFARNLSSVASKAWQATDRYLRGESSKTGTEAGRSIGRNIQSQLTKQAVPTAKKVSEQMEKNLKPKVTPELDPKQARENLQKLKAQMARDKAVVTFNTSINQQRLKDEVARFKADVAKDQIRLQAELNAARIQAQLERLKRTQKVEVDAELNDSAIAARLAFLTRDRIIRLRVRTDKGLENLNQATSLLGLISTPANLVVKASGLTSAASGLFVVAQALSAIVVGAAQASGVLLTLPAMLAGIGVGVGVLVTAFKGFGDALSSDTETAEAALAQLPGPARESALALRGMRPALGEIRKEIQGAFWKGLAPQLRGLSTSLLPAVSGGLTGVAESANGAASEFLSFTTSKATLADIELTLGNIKAGFDELLPSVQPVGQALLDITAVGSEYLPAMGAGTASLTQRFAEFISNARETGQLKGWIDTGITAARELGNVFGATGRIIGGLFSGLSGDISLQSIGDALHGVADAVGSSGVQELLGAFSEAFTNNLSLVSQSLPSVSEAFQGLLPSITGFIEAGGESFGAWLQSVSDIAIQFQPVIDGLVRAFAWFAPILSSIAPYLTLVTAGIIAFRIAMFALNLVMYANPIGLIVAAIALLIAGLLWAYNNVEWFRTGVQAVWSAISTGALWLWNNALQPFFSWIYNFITVTLAPVWQFLGTTVQFIWNLIATAISLYWNYYVKPIFAAIVWVIQTILVPVFVFLWNAAKFAWSIISTAISIAWGLIKIIFAAIVFVLRNTLGPIFSWLYNTIIKPVWSGIRTAISVVWDFVRDKVFSPMKTGIERVADSFKTGKDNIKTAFQGIRDAAKAPIRFLVETVYMGALKPMWDKVAKVVNADPMPSLTLPAGFASGGILPGYSTFRQGDSISVPMRPGEGVYVSEAMRDPYEKARLLAVNKAAMRGQSLAPYQGFGFARGGWLDVKNIRPKTSDITDGLSTFIKDVITDVFTGDLGEAVDTFFKPIHTATSMFGKTGLPGIPYMGGKKINGWVKDKVESLASFWQGDGGGADSWTGLENASERLQRSAAWARTQHGLPYQWGGNGNPSWDCSGFVSAIESMIRVGRPFRRWSTHAFAGNSAPAGWVRGLNSPFTIGITHSGVGHTAGTLMGVNVESAGGGKGVRVGSSARGAKNSLFSSWYGFKPVVGDNVARMASGGWVRGIGSGTSDSNIILASHGEFMVKAKQAAKHGGLLEAINNDQLHSIRANINTSVPERDAREQPLIGTLNANLQEGTVEELVNEIGYHRRKNRIGRKYP